MAMKRSTIDPGFLCSRPCGEDHFKAKISDHDCELIRALREDGMAWSLIAEKFEVPKRTVRDICAFKRRYAVPMYGRKRSIKDVAEYANKK